MAIFNPTQTKLISKLTVGSEVYYLKDSEAPPLTSDSSALCCCRCMS